MNKTKEIWILMDGIWIGFVIYFIIDTIITTFF